MLLPINTAGSVGVASVIEKLLSIRATEAMVGLSAALSCKHNNAMCIHLNISRSEPELFANVGSITFEIVPCRQLFQAYKNKTGLVIIMNRETVTNVTKTTGVWTYKACNVRYILPISETMVPLTAYYFKN